MNSSINYNFTTRDERNEHDVKNVCMIIVIEGARIRVRTQCVLIV